MSDRITITGISGHGFHGVLESERATGQVFVIDLVVETDIAAAAATDDLHKTVDYSAVALAVHEVIVGPPVNLIETLAERIAHMVLAQWPVDAVEVTVHKPDAPIAVPVTRVSVQIRRERS